MATSILVQVRLIGSGVNGDAFRANLPTYIHIHGNIENGAAIVSIPLDVLGLTEADLEKETAHPTTEGPLYTQLSADNLAKAQKHLDEAYPKLGYELQLVSA